jgi:hypothetical protein
MLDGEIIIEDPAQVQNSMDNSIQSQTTAVVEEPAAQVTPLPLTPRTVRSTRISINSIRQRHLELSPSIQRAKATRSLEFQNQLLAFQSKR